MARRKSKRKSSRRGGGGVMTWSRRNIALATVLAAVLKARGTHPLVYALMLAASRFTAIKGPLMAIPAMVYAGDKVGDYLQTRGV